ncbi:MAG: fasciclin domain-containing protein [Dermatophilaceae bacterium]
MCDGVHPRGPRGQKRGRRPDQPGPHSPGSPRAPSPNHCLARRRSRCRDGRRRSRPAANASAPGTNSLANVLLSDGDTFDGNSNDFDIVTQAALAVLAAKPSSPVKVLTDGTTPVTAFIPRDQAFRLFVYSTTGKWVTSEQGVFNAVASFGIDTVETVLLYHVVAGATIDRATALKADGAALGTAAGAPLTVDIVPNRKIELRDLDPDATDAPRALGRLRHQQGQPADRARHRPRPAPARPAEGLTPAAVPGPPGLTGVRRWPVPSRGGGPPSCVGALEVSASAHALERDGAIERGHVERRDAVDDRGRQSRRLRYADRGETGGERGLRDADVAGDRHESRRRARPAC